MVAATTATVPARSDTPPPTRRHDRHITDHRRHAKAGDTMTGPLCDRACCWRGRCPTHDDATVDLALELLLKERPHGMRGLHG
jgi:hypothetical protein